MTGAVATFNPAAFKLLYPNWAAVADLQLQAYFDQATLYLRNDGTGPVRTPSAQLALLNMLTAHITQLSIGLNGKGPAPIVGRLNSASEGSVSVGADFPSVPGAAWYMQTTYGSNFWQATAAYRMANYRPGPTRFGTGIGAGRGGWQWRR